MTDNDFYLGVGEQAGGLTKLEFAVAFPDDSVLTTKEVGLLTKYNFAPIA